MVPHNSLHNAFYLLILFSSVLNLVLGGMVLADNRRKINRLFFILCFDLCLWGISFIGLNFSSDPPVALMWCRLYIGSLLFVPPLFYHFVLGGISHPAKGHETVVSGFFDRAKQLGYVFSGGWLFLTMLGMFPHKVVQGLLFSFPSVGQHFYLAAIAYALLTAIGLVILIRHATLAEDPAQKSRLLAMLLVGAGFIVMGGIFIVSLFYTAQWVSGWTVTGAHLASTFCLILFAYTLTSNQLYHLSELLRKSASFLVMTSILLAVFLVTHLISRRCLTPFIPRSDYLALGMASIVMALLFHPLRFRVQNVVDSVFFTKRFDQMQRLRGLSRRVLSSADRDELLNVLFSTLKSVGFGSMCLLLKDPQRPIFTVKKAVGVPVVPDDFHLKSESLLIQYLREEKRELVRDEVIRRVLADWERQALGEEMNRLQADVCFPLFSTRRRALFGAIVVGNSDLGYSSYVGRNIFWLKSVVENAGIMLDNFYHHDFANALIPYVGRTWADEMRRNKEGFRERLAGHRTWVSILMVDIRHFTTMSARMDPQDVVSLLNEFRSRIAPVVYRYQGTIDKFIGDAIMIVFGTPILPALENADQNAVQCAAAIMKEIYFMNQSRIQAGFKEGIAIGIGVSSGVVIAGNVDSGDRVEYTVIGDAPNMVARLEDMAGDNQILLSPATFSRVKDLVDVKAWEPRVLTGFNDPVTVYELLSVKDALDAKSSDDYGSLVANQ
ncbi:MAG: hypothetical protein LHV69_06605 [Elusimicrobia bacterium]|nr:hypothetical protein [Candidatus Obscuribacterium magneticum]